MPSPIGHGLGGIAAGWLVAPRHDRVAGWALAAIGAAVDLDLLANDHRGPAHSIGAAMIVGFVVWLITRRWRWGAAAALAWTSHVLLDWLGEDSKPPIGIEALWPFSDGYYRASHTIFPGVARQFWRPWPFIKTNSYAAMFELILLLPIVFVILKLRSIRQRDTC